MQKGADIVVMEPEITGMDYDPPDKNYFNQSHTNYIDDKNHNRKNKIENDNCNDPVPCNDDPITEDVEELKQPESDQSKESSEDPNTNMGVEKYNVSNPVGAVEEPR